MDELVRIVVESAPNFIGFGVAVYVLQKTITRLLDETTERINRIEVKVDQLQAMAQATRHID